MPISAYGLGIVLGFQVQINELCDNADEQEQLFDNVRRNSHHTLHNLLPPESLASQNCLRSRVHDRQLPEHFNHLDDSNFIIRMLYKNMY